ncbi:hypothetical protein KFL_001970045 [Klebsormidium nitens]|uniref:C2 domain-containing protein n=1 Tax=Klebsormidium nitens TaxID=105231 RepID=A0A1Y1I2A3_KLENI|nr:hypothetical protein KFL_001970045 [Klebsormidium nitens]|eukprot:GAQ84603.1 hypothetical protein KFL_001970045 [Klebsormidium nitens]
MPPAAQPEFEKMTGPPEKEKTKRMQFEGVEWSIKDPPLLTSLRIKWWGQDGEGTTSRIYAKSSAHLLTSATNLVFPAMCGPKNLSSYFHDMHNLPVEITSGSGPARVVGKAEIDISDLVRVSSISRKNPLIAGQRTVGVVPLTISVNFFPTVVTSFELNEHQAEADTLTPVLPTPRLTTWRAAAASGSKTGVGGIPAEESGPSGIGISPLETGMGRLEPPDSSRRTEDGSQGVVSAASDVAGGVVEQGNELLGQSVLIESGNGDGIASSRAAEQLGGDEMHSDQAKAAGDESTARASEQPGLGSPEVTAFPDVGEKASEVAQLERVNEGPKGPSNLDAELRALIARAEKLREAMTRASETVPVPVSSAAARLARLELPLIGKDRVPIPQAESIFADGRGGRERNPRSSLRRIVDVLDEEEGLVTRYGPFRRRGRSVLSPRHSSNDSSDGSNCTSDGSDGSYASDSWAEPDSEDDPRGVAEDELLKELFFAEAGSDRRRIADESSDQDMAGGAEAPRGEAGERPGLASSVEQATTVRIVVGHLVLGGTLGGESDPPPSCTLSMRLPVVPPAMADVAAVHPPQAMSIVPSKVSAKGLVFRHSAEFPVRMADPDVRQLWQFGELRVEAHFGRGAVRVECRGSVSLEDVLSSVPASFRTSVPLYIEAREENGEKGQSRGLQETRDGSEVPPGEPEPAEERNDSGAEEVGRNEGAAILQTGGGAPSGKRGEAEEGRGAEGAPDAGSDWRLDEGVLFGTLDLEVQLLSSGRGGAQKPAETPALTEFYAIDDGRESRVSPPRLLVQVKCVELSSGRQEAEKAREGEVILVAKAPRSAGGDVELRVHDGGFGRGQKLSQLREGIVPAPKELAGSAIARQEGTLVVEVWERSHAGDVSESRMGDVSEALLGLVRVPLRRRERPPRLRGLEGSVQDQLVEIWDPLTGLNRGEVRVTVWLGSAAQIQQFVWETAAAVCIQRYARGFAARKRVAAQVAARREEELGMGRGACVKHTFRVTVVGAAGLPAGEALYDVSGARAETEADPSHSAKHAAAQGKATNPRKKAVTFKADPQHFEAPPRNLPTSPLKKLKSAEASGQSRSEAHPSPPEGHRFIKYWFPGETEPLYTRNVDWSGSPRFGAQAWHSITLPVAERIGDHFGAAAHGLRFEVWDRVDTWQGERGPEECHVGAAELQMDVLLKAADVRRPASGPEFKKTFELPIRLAEGIPPGEGFPRLQVELSYQASAVFQHPLADTVFAPQGQPLPELPIKAVLDIRIIRASGLQAAVAAAIPTSPSLRTVLHSGAHSYVRLSLFPSSHELELQYPPIHTPLQAQTFTPHYGFHRRLSVTVNEEVLEAFRTGVAVLEVWHHAPRSMQAEGTNSWLGTVSVPLSQLVKNEKGINGWYDILSRRGDMVGAIELDIAVAEWRPLPQADDHDVILTSPEPLSPPISPPSRAPNTRPLESSPSRLRTHSRGSASAAQKEQEMVARLTVSVEEVVLPKEGGKEGGLQELLGGKRAAPDRFYAVHARYGEAEPCVSRAVPTAPEAQSTSRENDARGSGDGDERSVLLEHTCEVITPFDDAFLEHLKQRLAVEVWRVDSPRDPSRGKPTSRGERRERGRDRLVGTAYVGLSPLLDHGVADLRVPAGSESVGVSGGVRTFGRQKTEAPKTASLSGAFALVHPDSANLGNARVIVRILLQLAERQKPETDPSGHSQEALGSRSRFQEASPEPLSPVAGSGSPEVTLGVGDSLEATSEVESEEGLGEERQEEGGYDGTSLSPERGSEASDDVDEEDWLQQRALRRSAELLRRSKEARAGKLRSDDGLEFREDEGVSEREGDGHQTGETSVRSPERAALSVRSDERGDSRRATRMEGIGETDASRLLSEGKGEESEIPRGPARRLAGHVTVTAPLKRGPAGRRGMPTTGPRTRGSGEERRESLSQHMTPGSTETGRPAPGQSPEPLQAAPTDATAPLPDSLPTAAPEMGQSVPPQRRVLQIPPEQRYTSVRVCIEAAMNLQFTACHSQAEEDFWAGAETSKTLKLARAETGTTSSLEGSESAGTAGFPLRNVPQGLFVSYRWQETGEVVCSPLVGPSSSPKWYHSRHLPLATPSRNRPTDRVLVLKAWKRLPEPGSGGSSHVGGVNALPLQLGAHARAQEAVPSPDLDRLVGCAAIDLSPLFLGMEELCGWYTVHDLRQRSLGQLKVVVSPVDVILTSYRPADAEGGEVRLRSPPQRGPPGGAGARRGNEELTTENAVSQEKAEALIEEFKLESQVEEETLEGGGLNEEESFGEVRWGRESSMEDVRLRLEELQEMSRKILARRGLDERGGEVPESEPGVGVSGGGGGVAEAARDRGPEALESGQGAEVSYPYEEVEKAGFEATVAPAKGIEQDASGGVNRDAWHEGSGDVTQDWHAEEGGLLGHFSANVDVFAGGEGSPEEADGVEYGRDDLEGGQGGDGWSGDPPRVAVSFEMDEGGDGNDGWAQASPAESNSPGLMKATGSTFGESFASIDEAVTLSDSGNPVPGKLGRKAAADFSIASERNVDLEKAKKADEESGDISRTREDGNGTAEGVRIGTSQNQPPPSNFRATDAEKAIPETVRGHVSAIGKGAEESKPLAQAMVVEERSVFERRSVLEERAGPSNQLPPRPPKREGAPSRYPFTLHSSITFVPAPLKRFRTGPSALVPKSPPEGPWSSQVVRTERDEVKRVSRLEEVEGFRGFSRRVEAVVSAAAASGPVWPHGHATKKEQLERSGNSEQRMRLVAQAEVVESDGEGQRARTSRKREAEQSPEIWKEAWLAPLHQPHSEHSKLALGKELSAKLDSEILALGGYKKLVIARWARVAQGHKISSDEEFDDAYCDIANPPRWSKSTGEKEYTSSRTRYLVLIRVEGSLLLWGLYKAEALGPPRGTCHCKPGAEERDTLSLSFYDRRLPSLPDPSIARLTIRASRFEPVYVDVPVDKIQEHWRESYGLVSRFGGTNLEFQELVASMEIYACLDERTDPKKLPPTRKGKTWECFLFLRHPSDPSQGYHYLDCGFGGRFYVFVKDDQEGDIQDSQSSLLLHMAQAAVSFVSEVNEKLCQAGTWIADLFD